MPTIREAILLAADHIERNRWSLRFMQDDCSGGATGCPLVWIGRFLGETGRAAAVASLLGCKSPPGQSSGFFARMDAIGPKYTWQSNATICARTLRAYADAHHPARDVSAPYDWAAMVSGPYTIGDSVRSQDAVA